LLVHHKIKNFSRFSVTSNLTDSWEHLVTGEGGDAGLTFLCRWEALPLKFELAGDQGRFLDAVLA
jgi:hypothetical protein